MIISCLFSLLVYGHSWYCDCACAYACVESHIPHDFLGIQMVLVRWYNIFVHSIPCQVPYSRHTIEDASSHRKSLKSNWRGKWKKKQITWEKPIIFKCIIFLNSQPATVDNHAIFLKKRTFSLFARFSSFLSLFFFLSLCCPNRFDIISSIN